MSEATPLLEMRGIHKTLAGVPVLQSVDFTLLPGQIHAVMGGNGAGKSTLMKIIAGIQSADGGEMYVASQLLSRLKPNQAQQLGIYLVAQEPMLFAQLTVRENILFRLKNKRQQAARLPQLLEQLDCTMNLQAAASTLDMAGQQMVEILRGLLREAKILIMDEPTSSLTPGETVHLFRQLRILQAAGTGIIFISHKLPEIRALASHVSVMRDGAIVLCGSLDSISDSTLVNAMTPKPGHHALRETQQLWPQLPAAAQENSEQQPVLRVENLTGEGFVNASLTVAAGEIVGLSGLVGAGRTELAETLYGLRAAFAGTVWLHGKEISRYSVKRRLQHGLVYLPEDRQISGLFVDASVCWNSIVLRDTAFWLHPRREAAIAEGYRRALGIVFQHVQQPVRTLSGGNQQKVLLARCLEAQPRLLIVDEPTRGVDVAARADIYQLVKHIAARQVAVLMISSDVDEVVGLADRVLVMHQGVLAGELSGQALSVDNLMALAFGGGSETTVS